MSRGAFVVSLDFELHWGMRDLCTVEQYRANLLGVRAAVPALLALFAEFGIRATWATVGFLFFESRDEMLAALPARKPSYTASRLSPYAALAEIGKDEHDDPFHFAASLVRRIADTPGQEIGTHTFSHYYCLEEGQSVDEFRADLEAACRLVRAKLERPAESIVFPRNQMTAAHLAVCRDLGLIAYRGNPDHWAYRASSQAAAQAPLRRALRLADAYVSLTGMHTRGGGETPAVPVNVPASRYLRPYLPALRRLEPLRLRRITGELEHAAATGGTFHLWWHPHDFGVHTAENLAVLRRILTSFAHLRERHGMESLTMAEAARRTLGVAFREGARVVLEERRAAVRRSAPPSNASSDDRPPQRALVPSQFASSGFSQRSVSAGREVRGTISEERRAAAVALAEAIGLPRGSRILEIGSGAGSTALALAQRGYVVHAVDPVPRTVELIRRVALEAGLADRIVAGPGDVDDLRFADATFALVLALGVTPRLDASEALLRELGRVLRPGGRLIMSADDPWRPSAVLDPRWSPPPRRGADRMRRLQPRPRMRMSPLHASGLHQVDRRSLHANVPVPGSPYLMVARRTPRTAPASLPAAATLIVFERQTCH